MKVNTITGKQGRLQKLRMMLNVFGVLAESFIRGKRKCKGLNTDSKVILIAYSNVIGDSICFMDIANEFDKLYPKADGYDVRFLCRPAIKKLYEDVFPECTLNLVAIDWVKFSRNYGYYRSVLKQYDGVYDKVIVPYAHTRTNDLFCRSVKAREKIAQEYDMQKKKAAAEAFIYKDVYTDIQWIGEKLSILESQRMLIQHLGNKNFKSRFPKINPIFNVKLDIPQEKYIILGPTSNLESKRWPLDRFAQLADWLVEKFSCPICICGGSEEPNIFARFAKMVKHKDRLVDYACKTDFKQWMELFRNAKMVICNDSANYHVASAVRTPVIGIAGDFANVNVPLYEPDVKDENGYAAILLYNDMPCHGCIYKGYEPGFGNALCNSGIDKGCSMLCVQQISLEQVKNAVCRIEKLGEV